MSKWAIWDIDNCLADDSHRIGAIDWSSSDPRLRYVEYHKLCTNDEPSQKNVRMLQSLNEAGITPLFITGRPEEFRLSTKAWLFMHCGLSCRDTPIGPMLLMRPRGNEMGSVDLKRFLLNEWIEKVDCAPAVAEIVCAFDDHEGILEMYREEFGIQAFSIRIHELDAYRNESGLVRTDLGPVQGARPLQKVPLPNCRSVLPVRKVTAADRLDAMAKTFRERNGVYRDNYRKVPELMKVLFGEDGPPSGLVMRPEWHLFELMLVKLTRFTQTELTHADSIHDIAIYGAMIDAILNERQQVADNERAIK